ncbi:hypothetical protein AgCh_021084 [Apium graveolens]
MGLNVNAGPVVEELEIQRELENEEPIVEDVKEEDDHDDVDSDDKDDDDDKEEDGTPGGSDSSKQSRSETKSRKAMLKLGMKPVTGVGSLSRELKIDSLPHNQHKRSLSSNEDSGKELQGISYMFTDSKYEEICAPEVNDFTKISDKCLHLSTSASYGEENSGWAGMKLDCPYS